MRNVTFTAPEALRHYADTRANTRDSSPTTLRLQNDLTELKSYDAAARAFLVNP